jgi:hypothetical protein
MIYCDLGALSPADADLILAKAKAALAPEGLLVFDVFGPTLAEERKPLKSWYRSGGPGFWSEQPHLVMEETFSYPEARAFASQTVVVGDGEPEATLYRTWDRWFDEDSLTAMLRRAGYLTLEIRGDLIEPNDFAPSGVLFAAATPETGSVGERSRGA